MRIEQTLEREQHKEKQFVLAVLVLLFFRQALVSRLPLYIIANSPHDDGWVVSRAASILAGEWMGAYDQYTLIKGAFAPLLMAFSNWLGVTFTGINTLLYCLACIFFIQAIRPFVKGNLVRLLLFAVLLFNPVSYALTTWQRPYRNGMAQWQLLFIFASVIAVYARSNKSWKTLVKWEIVAGITLWSFINTREDGVWIYPFILCATLITAIAWLKQRKGKQLILLAVPFAILISGNAALKAINNAYYGAPIINDRVSGNYAKAMRDLYMIKPDQADTEKYSAPEYKDLYYNIYRSTLEKAYAVSPTLNTFRNEIDEYISAWDGAEPLVDGELMVDHILFAIRDGIAEGGYYKDAASTEKIYENIHKELKEGFETSLLTKKKGFSISAASMPIEMKNIPNIIKEFFTSLQTILSFEDVSSAVVNPRGSLEGILRFEDVTGNRAPRLDEYIIHVSGWVFAHDEHIKLHAAVYTNAGECLTAVPLTPGVDVYEHYATNGFVYENALMSRFSVDIEGVDINEKISLRLSDAYGERIMDIPITLETKGCSEDLQDISYCIDDVTWQDNRNLQYVNRANKVAQLYKTCGMPIFFIAVFCYVMQTLDLIKTRKTFDQKKVCTWLLATGILLSLILYTACMAYMTVTTYFVRIYYYLSPAYILDIMFCCIVVASFIEGLLQIRSHQEE